MPVLVPMHMAHRAPTAHLSHETHCMEDTQAVALAKGAGICPRMWWLRDMQRHVWLRPDPLSELLYINVGVNKGYNVAAMSQLFRNASFTNADWHKSMREYIHSHGLETWLHKPKQHKPWFTCGNCNECNEVHHALTVRPLRIVGFDIMSDMIGWVTAAAMAFKLPAVTVVHAAVADKEGYLYVPKLPFGSEVGSTSSTVSTGLLSLRATTVDAYAAVARISHIHFVSIDAENHDGEVNFVHRDLNADAHHPSLCPSRSFFS